MSIYYKIYFGLLFLSAIILDIHFYRNFSAQSRIILLELFRVRKMGLNRAPQGRSPMQVAPYGLSPPQGVDIERNKDNPPLFRKKIKIRRRGVICDPRAKHGIASFSLLLLRTVGYCFDEEFLTNAHLYSNNSAGYWILELSDRILPYIYGTIYTSGMAA